jgi:O-antigen/teichoic acid export membrane protein
MHRIELGRKASRCCLRATLILALRGFKAQIGSFASYPWAMIHTRLKSILARSEKFYPSSLLVKILAIFANFIALGIVVRNCGAETFGLYSGYIAIATLLSVLDFGIPNSVIGTIAKSQPRDVTKKISTYISSSIFLITLLFLSAMICIVILAFFEILSFGTKNQTSTSLESDLTFGLIILTGVLLQTLAILAQKVFLGSGQNKKSHFWSLSTNLLNIISVLIFSFFENPIFWMILGYLVVPNIYGCLAWFKIYSMYPTFFPSIKSINLRLFPQIIKHAQLFFILQITSIISVQSDALYALLFLSPSQAAELSLIAKIMILPSSLAIYISLPLWAKSASADTPEKRSYLWSELIDLFKTLSVIGACLAILYVAFGEFLISRWTGENVVPNFTTLFFSSLVMIILLVSQPAAMVLNGLHAKTFLVSWSLLSLLLKITLSIVFTIEFGIIGPLVGTLVSQLICSVLPSLFYLRKNLGGSSQHKPIKF